MIKTLRYYFFQLFYGCFDKNKILDIFRKMESAGIGGIGKNDKKYYCHICDHYACQKSDFDRHCITLKHQKAEKRNRLESAKNVQNDEPVVYHNKCSICNKEFITQSGLWKHSKTCHKTQPKEEVEDLSSTSKVTIEAQNKIISMLLEERGDIKKIQDQQNEILLANQEIFKEIIHKLAVPSQITNNNTMNNTTNNTINNNNTFNLNLFLNETCKDAMNFSEFLRKIQINFDDLEHLAKNGYVDGMSNIIIKNLSQLRVEERPIHCTDAKRETMYVKENDKWEKEKPDSDRFTGYIYYVQNLAQPQRVLWRDAHPLCLTATSIYTDVYNNMFNELTGGNCETIPLKKKDERIMKQIAKSVVLDKNSFKLL